MVPELGHLALWFALFFALGLALLPALGVVYGKAIWVTSAQAFATGQFVFATLAFAVLTSAFLDDDFSVAYVAHNSNSLLPWYYKLSATWGAHEGSMLLWIVIMCVWTLAVVMGSRSLPFDIRAIMLSVLGLLSFGFILFSLTTSNPFERLLPFPPIDGIDLNPQLQDFGLIIHPPMLYLGYIGFSVVFAFAVAALCCGRLDAGLVRWCRPWTNLAWSFLGLGIVLGSWWAYYELGWGGWWFWDAVENASFMPWLVATALIHSLAVTDKRGIFKHWTILLALLAFSFSLVGAFLVRSGVLTSVHSFAVDPERGLFILAFLVLVVGSSLTLYAIRAPRLTGTARYTAISRESSLLINNLLLLVIAGAVFLGTLFPLIYEVLHDGQKLSVGPPYFNRVCLPFMALLVLVMGLGPLLRWQQTPLMVLLRQIRWLSASLVLFGILIPLVLLGVVTWQVGVVSTLALWGLQSLVIQLIDRWRKGGGRHALNASWWGMWLGHLGFIVCMLGVVLTSQWTAQKDVLLAPGQDVVVGGYRFHFAGVSQVQGANYTADRAELRVRSDGFSIGNWLGLEAFRMHPEKRYYLVRNTVMTEVAIVAGFWRDLYVALGSEIKRPDSGSSEVAADTAAWSMRIQHKPFVRWIWLGGILMALGGLLALRDRRYLARSSAKNKMPQVAQGETT